MRLCYWLVHQIMSLGMGRANYFLAQAGHGLAFLTPGGLGLVFSGLGPFSGRQFWRQILMIFLAPKQIFKVWAESGYPKSALGGSGWAARPIPITRNCGPMSSNFFCLTLVNGETSCWDFLLYKVMYFHNWYWTCNLYYLHNVCTTYVVLQLNCIHAIYQYLTWTRVKSQWLKRVINDSKTIKFTRKYQIYSKSYNFNCM